MIYGICGMSILWKKWVVLCMRAEPKDVGARYLGIRGVFRQIYQGISISF